MEDKKLVSVLDQGDEFCRNRILARKPSTGQSSRIFYRAAEGVPFEWEKQPGTPKNPQEEDAILPICPSPLMQSLGLPLPNLDHEEKITKSSRIRRLKKMAMRRIGSDVIKKVEIVLGRRSKLQESSRFGDCDDQEFMVKDSSFSTYSSFSSSNVVDNDGPFCCSPWNVPAILEEGSTRIYYCSKHKTAFAVEEDGSFLSRILTRVSTGDQFSGEIPPAGVPFRWETQPGTPTHPPENNLMIPPPSPPPAVQSLSLPPPRLCSAGEGAKKWTWRRAWIWLRAREEKKKEMGKMQHEISFRCNEKMEISSSDWEFDASFRDSGSVSSLSSTAPISRNGSSVSKIRRNFQGRNMSCGPWRKEDILVFVRGKLKSFRS